MIQCLKTDLDSGVLNYRKKEKTRSAAWEKFCEIYCCETDVSIDYFHLCEKCKVIIFSPYVSGPTTKLLRHKCYPTDITVSGLSKNDIQSLKMAKYVSYDLRPYFAFEGDGLKTLLKTTFKLGQKNRQLSEEQFLRALPSRNTVNKFVSEIANDSRAHIGNLLKEAIHNGGVDVITDTRTDNHRHQTYLALVAHICLGKGINFKCHRFVMSTSLINEVVKTGK